MESRCEHRVDHRDGNEDAPTKSDGPEFALRDQNLNSSE